MPQLHDLKTKPSYFDDVRTGRKRAEIRKNDRGFEVGDQLMLWEWKNKKYTGRGFMVQVTHITSVNAVLALYKQEEPILDLVVLSYAPVGVINTPPDDESN